MNQQRFVAAFLLFPVGASENGKEINVESLRDVKRAMEREVKKGSCPLMFGRLEFGSKPFQSITSEEKLDEVLAYLLRIKSFGQYAGKTIINNVYMDLDMLCKKPQFKRTHSAVDREGVYTRVQMYKKRMHPDYDGGFVWKRCGVFSHFRRRRQKNTGLPMTGRKHMPLSYQTNISSVCLPTVRR